MEPVGDGPFEHSQAHFQPRSVNLMSSEGFVEGLDSNDGVASADKTFEIIRQIRHGYFLPL